MPRQVYTLLLEEVTNKTIRESVRYGDLSSGKTWERLGSLCER